LGVNRLIGNRSRPSTWTDSIEDDGYDDEGIKEGEWELILEAGEDRRAVQTTCSYGFQMRPRLLRQLRPTTTALSAALVSRGPGHSLNAVLSSIIAVYTTKFHAFLTHSN